jgi:hypothetical protein
MGGSGDFINRSLTHLAVIFDCFQVFKNHKISKTG